MSVGGVLDEMSARIRVLEERNIQVLESLVGFVSRNDNTFHVPIHLTQGMETVLIGVGDAKRILDLDLVVLDPHGQEVTRDTLTDNVPVVRVTPRQSGTYVVKVVGASLARDIDDGFFAFIRGVESDAVVSIGDILRAAVTLAFYVESQGLQVEGVRWIPVLARTDAAVPVGFSRGASYVVLGVGAPTRVRNLDLTVSAPDGTVVGSDTEGDNTPLVPVRNAVQGTHTIVVRAEGMAEGVSAAHALLLWARDASSP
ncbi:MAG: hypothetical protein JXB39_08140 [Deltaproteobacteria bacterium]|nr:hypothetical protein [Deltaproteobacteria bacterium]